MTGNSYTCGEHSITYRVVETLLCAPETNITFSVNYTSLNLKTVRKRIWREIQKYPAPNKVNLQCVHPSKKKNSQTYKQNRIPNEEKTSQLKQSLAKISRKCFPCGSINNRETELTLNSLGVPAPNSSAQGKIFLNFKSH